MARHSSQNLIHERREHHFKRGGGPVIEAPKAMTRCGVAPIESRLPIEGTGVREKQTTGYYTVYSDQIIFFQESCN